MVGRHSCVVRDLLNRSGARPARLPIPTTWDAFLKAGKAIRRSFVARSGAKPYFELLTSRATRDGSNSTLMCQDIAKLATRLSGWL